MLHCNNAVISMQISDYTTIDHSILYKYCYVRLPWCINRSKTIGSRDHTPLCAEFDQCTLCFNCERRVISLSRIQCELIPFFKYSCAELFLELFFNLSKKS